MCGIVALLAARAPIERSRLDSAVHALSHRGPDGTGVFVSADDQVALGHRRLALVDPMGGTQPIANEDGHVVVVASGEVYAHDALRKELEERGHRFRTRSDSEVLVHLYEEEGVDFVARLRGELAFVLWDARARRLIAYRDRFGIRPLVWAVHDGSLYVASEVKALFAAGVPRRWDEESFFVAASLQYTLPDRTLFAGVRTLPPGSLLVASPSLEVDVRRYADLDYPREDDVVAEPDDLRALLREAVSLRTMTSLPVAFQLSGGLDSTAVLALAKETGVERPPAFTLAFEDPAYDERTLAERTCKLLDAPLTLVDASDAKLLDALPRAVVQGEGLAINAHIAAKYLLSRAIADAGFKIALSGEGADEVFAGYAHLRRDLSQANVGDGNALSVGTMLPSGEPTLSLSVVRAMLGSVPTFLEAKAALGARMHGLFDPTFAMQTCASDPMEAMLGAFDIAGQLRGRVPVHQSLYLWTRLALATYILRTLGDAMDLAHAVEVRLPFLDARVFDNARRIPPSLFAKDGREKYPLREAVRDLVPEHVLARTKHPLLAPLVATSEAGRALVSDVLLGSVPPFFSKKKLARLVDCLPALSPKERVIEEPVVMMLLSASILGQHYGLSA